MSELAIRAVEPSSGGARRPSTARRSHDRAAATLPQRSMPGDAAIGAMADDRRDPPQRVREQVRQAPRHVH